MRRERYSIWPLILLALAALACNTFLPGQATPTVDFGTPTTVEAVTEPCCGPGTGTAPVEPSPVPSDTPAAGDTPVVSPTPAAGASETPAATETTFVAYVRDGQLLVTDITGGVLGGTTQYTQPGVDDGVTDFVWSPSGEFIAYTGLVGDTQHIFVVYAEGAGTPVDLGAGATPAWSPDGTQLAYQNAGQIWVTAVEAPAPRQLTTQDNWAWGRPAFMPDGLSLAVTGADFNSMGASGNTGFFLYSLPLDGSGTLTPLPGQTAPVDGRLPYDLRFSPDGTKLAFSTSIHLSACASIGNYYVANNDGSNLRPLVMPALDALTNDDADDHFAAFGFAWRPDSAALLVSGLVRDCTDFAGTLLGAQMTFVTLDGAETLVAEGAYGPVSINDEGTLIAATFEEGSATGQVRVFDALGNLLLEVGEGNQARVQP